MGGAGRLRLLDLTDPEALSATLCASHPAALAVLPVLALGSRRQIARLAAKALLPEATAPLPLPPGAPYGAVLVKRGGLARCAWTAPSCAPRAR